MVRIAYKGGAQPVVGKNMRALHEVRMEFYDSYADMGRIATTEVLYFHACALQIYTCNSTGACTCIHLCTQ